MSKKALMTAAPVYGVMGNKGGLGKSAVARTLAENLKLSFGSVEIIDADTGNPDVAKVFGVEIAFNLNKTDGFLDIINQIESTNPETPVVISFPAGLLERAFQHGSVFLDTLPDLPKMTNRPFRVVWLVDNKRDVVESLKEFLGYAPGIHVDVFRNLHFASPDGFGLFDSSKTRSAIIENGGKVIDFPALASRVMATITNNRFTIMQASTELPLGDRLELMRWWTLVCEAFRAGGYIE